MATPRRPEYHLGLCAGGAVVVKCGACLLLNVAGSWEAIYLGFLSPRAAGAVGAGRALVIALSMRRAVQ